MNIRNFIFAGAVCAACSLTAFGQTVPKGNPPATPTNSEAKPPTIKKGSLSNIVVVIPLKGIVGPTLDGEEWFSATDFEKALAKAEKLSPAAIILEIKSPGGLVATEERIIQMIIDSQGRGTRIVAWVTDAGSAAALITLACKEIFVMPSARVGAAVTIVSGDSGTTSLKSLTEKDPELAAKYESFHSATHKSAAEATGRSPAIADAMRDMSKELWWSSEGGFSETRRAETDELIDGPKTVLTLTAGTMEKTGLAKQKNSLDEVIHSLGMRRSPEITKLNSSMEINPKKLKKLLADITKLRKLVNDSKSKSDNESHNSQELKRKILQAEQLLSEL